MIRLGERGQVGVFAAMLAVAFLGGCRSGGLTVTITPHLDLPTGKPPEGTYNRIHSSCGFILDPPPFAGTLVYKLKDGTTQAADRSAEFWRGFGEQAVVEGNLWPETVKLDRRGRFSHRVTISTNETVYYLGDVPVSRTESVADVVFLIRASGCNDLVVHFSEEWVQRVLELECPDRVSETRGPLSNYGLQPPPGRAAYQEGRGGAPPGG